jgi:hypothetical protein
MQMNAGAPDIGSLLDRQYQCTHDYCNATTALYNALQQQGSSSVVGTTGNPGTRTSMVAVRNATDQYMDALDRLQACMKVIETIVAGMSNDLLTNGGSRPTKLSVALTEHLARSQRIVRTIATQCGATFHANGLPQCPSLSSVSPTVATDHHPNQIKLVALATLRASIQSVQDAQ